MLVYLGSIVFWGALQANPSYGLRSHPHRSLRNHQTLLMAGLPGKNQDPSGKESEPANFEPFKVRFHPISMCDKVSTYVTKVELPLSIFPDLSRFFHCHIVLVDHWFIHLRSKCPCGNNIILRRDGPGCGILVCQMGWSSCSIVIS